MSRRRPGLLLCAAAMASLIVFASPDPLGAQRGRGQAALQVPPSGRVVAPIDLTGYWVSIISEDWPWRMITPRKGDYTNVPLTPEGRRVADTWDPDRDTKEGNQCKAYGAPGIMRMPVRLRISWENENTLRIDTDAGQQTRLLHFDKLLTLPKERTWQGHSLASWEFAGGRGQRGGPVGRPQGGSLKVVTTHMRPGYLRENGVSYSEDTVLTEYFDRHTQLGAEWITHTRVVDDPKYLTEPWVVTSHFKREADGSKWDPRPCEAGLDNRTLRVCVTRTAVLGRKPSVIEGPRRATVVAARLPVMKSISGRYQ